MKAIIRTIGRTLKIDLDEEMKDYVADIKVINGVDYIILHGRYSCSVIVGRLLDVDETVNRIVEYLQKQGFKVEVKEG